jgi:hypothetical protein
VERKSKERVKFDTDPTVRKAIQLRALLDDCDLQDVINAALRAYLAEQIKEVLDRGLVKDQSSAGTEPKSSKKKDRSQG